MVMQPRRQKKFWWLVPLLALALVLSACAEAEEEPSDLTAQPGIEATQPPIEATEPATGEEPAEEVAEGPRVVRASDLAGLKVRTADDADVGEVSHALVD